MITQVGTKTVTTNIYSFDLDLKISKIACLIALLRRTNYLEYPHNNSKKFKNTTAVRNRKLILKTIYFFVTFLPKVDNSSEDTAQQQRELFDLL